jgi:hypothetical protein
VRTTRYQPLSLIIQKYLCIPSYSLSEHTPNISPIFKYQPNISKGIIQARYSTHRTARNAQQKAKLLSPDFSGLILDPVLQKLEDPTIEPGFTDPRHCLVFWARPPAHIRSLVDNIQQELLKLAPSTFNTLTELLEVFYF